MRHAPVGYCAHLRRVHCLFRAGRRRGRRHEPALDLCLALKGELVTGEERQLIDVGQIRAISEAADGALWIITGEKNGRVLRVVPAGE
jgi:glucose/arabinose dehydrogenase